MAVRVRGRIHKWTNIADILCKDSAVTKAASVLFWNMRNATDQTEASATTKSFDTVLPEVNVSALRSFHEAKVDPSAIDELSSKSPALKRLFSTTKPSVSLNLMLEADTRRVKNWLDSEHIQRFLALAFRLSELGSHSKLDVLPKAA